MTTGRFLLYTPTIGAGGEICIPDIHVSRG